MDDPNDPSARGSKSEQADGVRVGAGEPLPKRQRFVNRRVQLPSGSMLEIRPIGRDDLDGVASLFAGLEAEDRYHRFFSYYRPSTQFLEGMTTVQERGGFGLVATVDGPVGRPRIVGEATFSPLPSGDAELGITVARDWRGWLGPYLLDALVESAAAVGVPRLHSEILVTNDAMLRMVRARGAAVTGHPDVSLVRVTIDVSSGGLGSSEGGERPRVADGLPAATSTMWPERGGARAAGARSRRAADLTGREQSGVRER